MLKNVFLIFFLFLIAFKGHTQIEVKSLDLRTKGQDGFIDIFFDGRLRELPDLKVDKNLIHISLKNSKNFSQIQKKTRGAKLSSFYENGDAFVEIDLPYDVDPSKVNINLDGNKMEVRFLRNLSPSSVATHRIKKTGETKKIKSHVPLDESYLNKLMNEEVTSSSIANKEKSIVKKTHLSDVSQNSAEIQTDDIHLSQSAVAKIKAEVSKKINPKKEKKGFISQIQETPVDSGFSFLHYSFKFVFFLIIVLGLFYGVVHFMKKGVFNKGKLGFLNNSQLIQVLSTTYIAPKKSLMIIKAHKQIFLVANSESGVQFLSEMSDTAGLIKEGEKEISGTNFDVNLNTAELQTNDHNIKIKDDITTSSSAPKEKGIQALTAKEIVKFSDELKKKARKLKPIDFNQ